MSASQLETTINSPSDARDGILTSTRGEVREAVDRALDLMARASCASPSARRTANGKCING